MKLTEQKLKKKVNSIANDLNCDPQLIYKQLFFERLLVRIAKSEISNKFIFKGGYLLNYCMFLGRHTKDIDFLMTQIQSEKTYIERAFEKICTVTINDGFKLQLQKITEMQQTHMFYPGFRVTISAQIEQSKIRDILQVDVSIGDEVEGESRTIYLLNHKNNPFFEDSISLQSYPMETVFAEKLETVLSKQGFNSRMKDFHDLIVMSRELNLLDKNVLKQSIKKTFIHRDTEQNFPIHFSDEDYKFFERYWIQHLKNIGDMGRKKQLPEHFKQVILEINSYLNRIT